MYGLVMDAWWFDQSQPRQDAVRRGPHLVQQQSLGYQLLWPNRRIDYIFSAAPRPGGAGHPTRTALLGTASVNGTYPSDHYALQADLRY